jgi:hypothetical protein
MPLPLVAMDAYRQGILPKVFFPRLGRVGLGRIRYRLGVQSPPSLIHNQKIVTDGVQRKKKFGGVDEDAVCAEKKQFKILTQNWIGYQPL